MSARHDYDDFFGEEDDTPVADTRADGRLYRVPVARIAPNLVNPRTDFGTEDQLIDLGKSLARRQNQPCPVVSRGAYLKLWPEHSDRINDVDYILVSGERRYRGATIVGLPALDCVANDSFAADRKTFMEAVVSENVDRQNFDPVEEAYAVQALVAEFGSNRAVAQHFERADGWVTQRILLTNLAREAQALVRAKAMPLEAARSLGKLARDNDWSALDQLEWWEREQERRSAASAARSAARKAARQDEATPVRQAQPSFTAVKHDPAPNALASDRAGVAPAQPSAPARRPDGKDTSQSAGPSSAPVGDPGSASVPRQADAAPGAGTVETAAGAVARAKGKPFPYDDGMMAAQLLIHNMDQSQLDQTYEFLTAHRNRTSTATG